MTTNFPTSLDAFTNPSSTDAMDSVTVPHATQHADLNDAVEALQAKVGVDSSAVTTSLDYKVANQGLIFIKSVSIGSAVSSVTVSNAFSSTYQNYKIILSGADTTLVNNTINFNFDGSTTGYYQAGWYRNYANTSGNWSTANNGSSWAVGYTSTDSDTYSSIEVFHPYETRRSKFTISPNGGGDFVLVFGGKHDVASSYTGFVLVPGNGTFTGGTIRVYGYNDG